MSQAKEKNRELDRLFTTLYILLTFPGIVIHEYAHRLFCDLAGVRVYKVCYLRLDKSAGYVIHEPIHGIKNAFLVAFGPLILNSILCMLLTFPISFPWTILDAEYSTPLFTFLTWAGLSIGMHALPSDIDAEGFAAAVAEKDNKLLFYLVATPIYWLVIFTNHILSRFWFDLIFACIISGLLPKGLLNLWVWLSL